MKRRSAKARYARLAVAMAISAALLIFGTLAIDAVTPALIGRRLMVPLLRLLLLIGIGLTVGQALEIAGWTRWLALLAGPLFRFAHLGPLCGAAFTSAFFSGTTANAMLYDYYQDDKITRRQLILTNLANQLPAYVLHLPTTVFIVIPLTGRAGGLYFLLTFIAALIRFVLVLVFGHFRPGKTIDPPEDGRIEPDRQTNNRGSRLSALRAGLKKKLPGRLAAIATYVVPIYIAVFLLNSAGLFEAARHWLARFITTAFVPMEALSLVVLSFAAEFTSGFAAAGALMQAGVLTVKQTTLALLTGNVVAFPIRALRHQLPRLIGIFAPKLGTQLLLLGQGFRVASLFLVGAVYYVVF